jgi:CheY-like chemotaxis protein
VASAAEALDLVGGERFDCALIDMHMPETNGAQLAAALRRIPAVRDMPLILASSITLHPHAGQRDLFDATLVKPTRASTLRTTLVGLLISASTSQGDTAPSEPLTSPGATGSMKSTGTGEIPARHRPLRVLLAEDNQVNQKVAQMMLAKLGHRVDTVGNGHEALQALHQMDYDVVLMDMQMPVLDGLEATRLIRAELSADRQPHIIAMTAGVLIEDRTACRRAGMDDYLAKPVRLHDLAAALTPLLAKAACSPCGPGPSNGITDTRTDTGDASLPLPRSGQDGGADPEREQEAGIRALDA